jgi:hypothetical protein
MAEIQKELKEYAKVFENKLQEMVSGFAQEVAIRASENTAVASQLLVDKWSKYEGGVYLVREKQFNIPVEPGYHAGAWKYYEGDVSFSDPKIYSKDAVKSNVASSAKTKFRLGDTFSIAAVGPNFEFLNNRDGTLKATEKVVVSSFSVNVQKYFNKG